jgi:hypothetical protein
MDVDDFENLCERLSRRQLHRGSAGRKEFPNATASERYEFVHALYREVLYRRQSPGRRAKPHLQVGERIEALYAERLSDAAAELAHHFEQARDPLRAAKYRQLAADTAGQRFEPRQAADSFGSISRGKGSSVRCSSLLYSRTSFILPGCSTENSFERFAEGGVGIVANGLCHFEQFFVALPQERCGFLHSSVC